MPKIQQSIATLIPAEGPHCTWGQSPGGNAAALQSMHRHVAVQSDSRRPCLQTEVSQVATLLDPSRGRRRLLNTAVQTVVRSKVAAGGIAVSSTCLHIAVRLVIDCRPRAVSSVRPRPSRARLWVGHCKGIIGSNQPGYQDTPSNKRATSKSTHLMEP